MLKQQYVDIKNVTHKVEHLVQSRDDVDYRERIAEEVLQALTKQGKYVYS